MSSGGAIAFAAAFRSVGIDARVCTGAGARALELGARHTSGEECLPAKVTIGGFLSVAEVPGFSPERAAFFMPTADGPCRFGQYAPYFEKVLADAGLGQAIVVSPNSRDAYAALGQQATQLMRTALRGLVCADLLQKMLHKTRPYEASRGDADAVHREQIHKVAGVLERPEVSAPSRMRMMRTALEDARVAFRRLHTRHIHRRPLIGVVGEIFCRLTPSTNEDVVRRIEALGAECTLAPLVEWIWYTNIETRKRLARQGRTLSKAMLAARISDWIQRWDEHRLCSVFAEEFRDFQEPGMHEVLQNAEPYLPASGALGEMTLSVGRTVSLHRRGCAGVVDVSPFTCMNGIVTEAVYPRVSADLDDMPIRNLYFDGTKKNVDRELGILVELAKAYQLRKRG